MKQYYYILITLIYLAELSQVVCGQNKSKILFYFPNTKESVTQDEFERVYAKNNGGIDSAKKHTVDKYKEYLKLYINFKRKVMAAEKEGLDTTKAFQQELSQYIKQLAQPYLVERDVLNKLIDEAYERSKFELRASHLLISCAPDAAPADTLKAFQKITAIRDTIVKMGKSFVEMAEKYSEDPSVKQNKGELGMFSVFDMVYPFESAAYATEPKQVSQPVRTQFGYHLVYVTEKVPAQGIKRIAHIIVRHGELYKAKDSAAAVARIQEVYQKLKNGADFAKLAAEYSDDPRSADKGGDLGNGRFMPEFEERKRKLLKGEFSEPFKTQFGWHILKVTEHETLKTFDQAKNELKQKVSRDSRSKIAEDKLIEKLKKEYKYTPQPGNIQKLAAAAGNDYLKPAYKVDSLAPAIRDLVLFTYADQSATSADLVEFAALNRRGALKGSPEDAIKNEMEQLAVKKLLEHHEKQLAKLYPEFRELSKEYRDGILLFTLTEQKVWRKAVEDTTGLKAFYQKNQDMFKAGDRYKIKEFRTQDSATIAEINQWVKEAKPLSFIDTSIVNQKKPVRTNIVYIEKNSNEIAKLFEGKTAGYAAPQIKEAGYFLIRYLVDILPAGNKSFEEARAEAISKYQEELERNWLEDLEKQYPVKIEEEILNKLYKK
jgi:peptidyl-prolyl cis-trans isomerase SurA